MRVILLALDLWIKLQQNCHEIDYECLNVEEEVVVDDD